MKRLSLLLGGSILLFTAFACGDGEPERFSGDPGALLDQAHAAMADLESYRLEMSVGGTEIVAYLDPAIMEFAAPDGNRFLQFGHVGGVIEVCEGDDLFSAFFPQGLNDEQTCREIWRSVSRTRRSVVEQIIVGDNAYRRRCEEAIDPDARDADREFDPWDERPRPPIAAPGSGGLYFPQWPFVAIELAEDIELVLKEERDDADLLHLRGFIQFERTLMENERRVLTAAGVTSFHSECKLEAIGQGGEGRQTICVDLTFEQALQQREPHLSFSDENPATIDIWVSRDGFLIHRVELSIPDDDPEGRIGVVLVEYSLFDQVQIEAPH